jgi:uncharacterized cupredoxin-like copper-binding protein
MKRMLIGIAAAAAVVAAAVLTAMPAFAHQQRQSAVNIKVTAVDLRFILKLKKAPHGLVEFMVTNKGHVQHNFKIAGKKTPLISPGQTKVLKVTLKKGKYTYLCTVPGHAAAGMKGVFRVT